MCLAHIFFHIVAFSCDSFQADALLELEDDDWTGTPVSDGYTGPGSGQYINYRHRHHRYRRQLGRGDDNTGVAFGYLGAKVSSGSSCTSWGEIENSKDGSLKAGLAIGVLGSLLGWLYLIVVMVVMVLDKSSNEFPVRLKFLNMKILMKLGVVMGPLMAILSGCLYLALSIADCEDADVHCVPTGKGHLIVPTCVFWLLASAGMFSALVVVHPKDQDDNQESETSEDNHHVNETDTATSHPSQPSPSMEERIAGRIRTSVLQTEKSRRMLIALMFFTWIFWCICVFDCSFMRAVGQNQGYSDGFDFGLFSQAEYNSDGDRYGCVAYSPGMRKDVALNAARAFGVFGFIFHTVALLLALLLELCLSRQTEFIWNTMRGLMIAAMLCSLLVFVALANENCTDENGLNCAPGPGGIVGIFNILMLGVLTGALFITPAPKETLFVVKRRQKSAEPCNESGDKAEGPPRIENDLEEAAGETAHLEKTRPKKGEMGDSDRETSSGISLGELSFVTASERDQDQPLPKAVATAGATKEPKSDAKKYEARYRNFLGTISLQNDGVFFHELPGTKFNGKSASLIRYQISWSNIRRVVLNTAHTKLRIDGTAEVCDAVPEQFGAFLLLKSAQAEELRDSIQGRRVRPEDK